MTNIDRAARILHDLAAQESAEDGFPKPPWDAEPVWEKNVWTGAAQALADAGLLAPAPTIIRTVEELEALDPDSLVLDCTGHLMTNRDRLPAVVVAPAVQVRAARKALEEA